MATGELTFENLQNVLGEFAERFTKEYKDRLRENDRIASGQLINSVKVRVENQGRAWVVTMEVAKWWKWVENGTRPHFPPVSAILKWVQIKPVIPRPDDKGRVPSQKSLAFLIARKISKVGTEGSFDKADTMEEMRSEFETRIRAAIVQDIQRGMIPLWTGGSFRYAK